MDFTKAALLLFICLLTGCAAAKEPAGQAAEPVRSVTSRCELTDAAADMLMHTDPRMTAAVPAALYDAADGIIRDAKRRSVLAGTMLDAVSWERSGRLLTVSAAYTDAPEAVRRKKQMLSETAAAWAESVSAFPPAVQVLLAHERLCGACAYSETAPDCGSAYGALIRGAARCSGFAEAFALLLEAADVPVCIVTGTDPDGTAHAWNLVTLAGSRYHVDCTWDCTADDPHTYFLRDDCFMRRTHCWEQNAFPAADGGALRYETIVQQMRDAVSPPSADKTCRRASASGPR